MKSRLMPIAAIALATLLSIPASASETLPIDDYSPYVPQTNCNPTAKPGTKVFAAWLVRRHGGGSGTIGRSCTGTSVSEHKEGRAFDWVLDARSTADRLRARAFLDQAFATDAKGNTHSLARRMGIMYIIWNDHMWSSYSQFQRREYLSSSCKDLKHCSRTLRHRDHMHISLSRRGGKGLTGWYAGRLPVSSPQ
jgi:hypothetical protein